MLTKLPTRYFACRLYDFSFSYDCHTSVSFQTIGADELYSKDHDLRLVG